MGGDEQRLRVLHRQRQPHPDHRQPARALRGDRAQGLHPPRDHRPRRSRSCREELWVDDELLDDDCAVLDAVVTLVDASNVHRQLRENKETALQIAFADTLVLNKTDPSPTPTSRRWSDRRGQRGRTRRASDEKRRKPAHVLNQGAVTVVDDADENRRSARSRRRHGPRSPPRVGILARARSGSPATTSASRASEAHDLHSNHVPRGEGFVDVRAFETWLEGALWERRERGETPADVDGDEGSGHHAPGDSSREGRVARRGEGGAERCVLQAVREVYEITEYRPRRRARG